MTVAATGRTTGFGADELVPRHEELAAPCRVLIVSADIGGGHHATGRALESAVRSRWPTAEVTWVDTLAVMRAGPAFRSIYRTNVEWTPWLYDFFYDQIWRHRWFADSSKWVTAVWAGLRLAPVIDRVAPDLILSTYPLGSGGLAWLRQRGRLEVPVGAWVSDFAPHPFWVHEALDLHVVMHADCVDLAHRAQPHARVVGPAALPVLPTFHDGDRQAARAHLGLVPDRYTVLVSCGVYGFGEVEQAVDVLLSEGGDRVQVVVATGRNAALRRRLERRPETVDRLRILGWTDAMPEVTRAADVMVTNAGGATALESLATCRPVLMFAPIAGHGMANAIAMADAGVAVLCRDTAELHRAIRRLLDEPAHRRALDAATAACTSGGTLADDLDRLLAVRSAGSQTPSVPLTAEDAFWTYVDSDRVPQRVAALALIRPGAEPVTAEVVHDALADTVPGRPWLTWRLDQRPGHQPRWLTGPVGRPTRLPVRPARMGGDAGHGDTAAFDAFVAAPLPGGAPAWEVEVAQDRPDGLTAVLIRAHHAFGDGCAVLDAFTGVTTAKPTSTLTASRRGMAAGPGRPVEDRAHHIRTSLQQAAEKTRGLLCLARSGAAPASPLRGRRSGGLPARHAFLALPDAVARAGAKAAGVGTSDLLVAVVTETLSLFLAERGTPAPSGTVRAMVPRTRRVGGGRGPGNRTTAVRVDLPVGPLPARDRLTTSRNIVAAAMAGGQLAGSTAVLEIIARLPPRLHAKLSRWIYRSPWFDLVVSVIPGPRAARWLGTARVEQAHAVLPLAEGIGLAVGILAWDDVLTVALTWDPVLLPDGERLAELVRPAFDALTESR